jgi:hypothetical protein
LHRLVRQVAAERQKPEAGGNLIGALATVYPNEVYDDPKTWPRARRLDSLTMAIVAQGQPLPDNAEKLVSYLLNQLAQYRHGPLAGC